MTPREPLVSVVVPAHNQARFIERAVRSVLVQTYDRLEVLVVDDGSTDETPALVEALTREDDRVRSWRRDLASGGAAVPRNVALEHARGDVVAFLDGDDEWLPSKLEGQLDVLDRTGADLVYSDAFVEDEAGERTRYWSRWPAPNPRPHGEVFEQLVRSNFVPVLTVLMSRRRVDDVGVFDPRRFTIEDYDYWLRASARGARFACLDEPTAVYRWHRANISHRVSHIARVQARVGMYDDLARAFPDRRVAVHRARRAARRQLADLQLRQAIDARRRPVERAISLARAVAGRPHLHPIMLGVRRRLRQRTQA